VSQNLFCRRMGSIKKMPFTGERVLAGKGGALRNVFSNGGRSDAAAPDSQKLFSCRSCSAKRIVACRRCSRRKEVLVSQKMF